VEVHSIFSSEEIAFSTISFFGFGRMDNLLKITASPIHGHADFEMILLTAPRLSAKFFGSYSFTFSIYKPLEVTRKQSGDSQRRCQ
jgi:hypothetical protein